MARLESDSIGTLEVPENAYYGVQTLRGYNNFRITGIPANYGFILNVVKIKKAAAIVNERVGSLNKERSDAIIKACDEILSGALKDEFITDAIQGGAGTTFNMNVNEVIANRATEIIGGKKGEYTVHPNDHVNCSQSTNDVIPSAGKLTVLDLADDLLISLAILIDELNKKAKDFDGILKMGRTQLEDAVPIRLGQEFGAYSSALKRNYDRIESVLTEMRSLNLGGTAIGTAINAKKDYIKGIITELSEITGYRLSGAINLIDATQNVDSFSLVSGYLKALAINLSKMCNDFRLMASGPKTGFEEINLPAMQNGSSIMPGKVNPVIPEVVSQVAFLVIGNDMTIAMAAEGGQLELNAFEPVIFYKLFESFICLTHAIDTLTENCVKGITANKERCEELVFSSIGIVTALTPYLGYKKSADIAKEALKKNKKIKDLVLEYGFIDKDKLEEILNPYSMT